MRMSRVAALASLAFAGGVLPAFAGIECRCLYRGQEFDQGAVVCIRIGSRARLARCDMVLNNSSWTFLTNSCPTARLTPLPEAAARMLAARS